MTNTIFRGNNRLFKKTATIFVVIMTIAMLSAIVPFTRADITIKTSAYLSVNPHLLGLGQQMTVNLWVWPGPGTPVGDTVAQPDTPYKGITITFTRPDGSKDTFAPQDGSAKDRGPGVTEDIGAIWFLYTPNQIGTWTVQFNFPGQVFTNPRVPGVTATFQASTSQVVTFTVQKDMVQIYMPPVSLPTDFWSRPINANNREWYQVSGPWLQAGYDYTGSRFNPYSKAPNTAHILWKKEVSIGGIIGGDWGSLSYGAGGGTPGIILDGRLYYNDISGLNFRCVNIRTGETLWTQTGTINLAQHIRAGTGDVARGTPESERVAPAPYLWYLGASEWRRYDAYTGALMQTITGVLPVTTGTYGTTGNFASYWSEGDTVVYITRLSGWNLTKPYVLEINQLIKWDYSLVRSNNWTTGIVWIANVTRPNGLPGPADARGLNSYAVITPEAIVLLSNYENLMAAFDPTTGARLWDKSVDYIHSGRAQAGIGGPVITWDSAESKMHSYDPKTGNELWSIALGEYPWGPATGIGPTAYGDTYVRSYDGYIYAVNVKTGQLHWRSDFAGNTTETPFGTYAYYLATSIADGKLYAGQSEHTPTQPRTRGNSLVCMDATNGKTLWKIDGAIAPGAIAEGTLIGVSEYDGTMYAFSKGKTATTVSAPQTAIPKGTGVLISGTVMDQSPASPNTPAIADSDMSAWMNYLHMQAAMPTNVNGVQVSLTATAPDGSTSNIGETTTDGYGYFQMSWTPPNTGNYKIQATFMGSESYWSSTAETGISVAAAAASPSTSPSGTAAPPPSSEGQPTMLYIGLAAVAIIIIIAVAVALLIRKRAK